MPSDADNWDGHEERLRECGGRAFPKDGAAYSEGMTLRDYFAAAALQGFLANGSQRLVAAEIENSPEGKQIADTEALRKIVNYQIARGIYLLVDAMIAERAK